jgi:hypothetical protein
MSASVVVVVEAFGSRACCRSVVVLVCALGGVRIRVVVRIAGLGQRPGGQDASTASDAMVRFMTKDSFRQGSAKRTRGTIERTHRQCHVAETLVRAISRQ